MSQSCKASKKVVVSSNEPVAKAPCSDPRSPLLVEAPPTVIFFQLNLLQVVSLYLLALASFVGCCYAILHWT